MSIQKQFFIKFTILIIVLFVQNLAASSISVAGNIESNTTWSSDTVFVAGDVVINDNVTLQINAGTKIIFLDNYQITVLGRFLSLGVPASPIYFTVKDTTGFSDSNIKKGGWGGIRFEDTPLTNDTSKILYSVFSYGKEMGHNLSDGGGAIYIKNFSKIFINESEFHNNKAVGYFPPGGAICCRNSNIIITNSRFYGNSTTAHGGAIYCDNSSPLIENCDIEDNIAGIGGGIACLSNANPIINNCTFQKNKVTSYNEGGGGISCIDHCNPQILGNKIIFNNGYNNGGGIYLDQYSDPIIEDNLISNNYAENGGAIEIEYYGSSNALLINNIISNNSASNGGGIFYGPAACARIVNCNIVNNSALNGGGIYTNTYQAPPVINTVIYGNSANSGAQVYLANVSGAPYFNFCDIEGQTEEFGGYNSNLYSKSKYSNSFDFIPLFNNPSNSSGYLIDATNADWSLDRYSPLINYGSTDTSWSTISSKDYLKNPRIIGQIDIGAIEFQQIVPSFVKLYFNPDTLMFRNAVINKYSSPLIITLKNSGNKTLNIDSLIASVGFYFSENNNTKLVASINGLKILPHKEITLNVVCYPSTWGIMDGVIRSFSSNNIGETEMPLRTNATNKFFVYGDITSNQVWQDSVEVTKDITVTAGNTLTVKPGAVILFEDHSSLSIIGQILAQGTKADSIYFTSVNPQSDSGWAGIHIYNFSGAMNSSDTSFFSYCNISFTCQNDLISAGISIRNFSKVIITDCSILNNKSSQSGGGIYVSNGNPIIKRNTIAYNYSNNKGGGVYLSTVNIVLDANKILNNFSVVDAGGIFINQNSNVMVVNSLICNNTGNYCAAVNILGPNSNAGFINCTIANNKESKLNQNFGIGLRSKQLRIMNSIVYNNAKYQVFINDTSSSNLISYSDILGGQRDGVLVSPAGRFYSNQYVNNIDLQPLFVAPTSGIGIEYNAMTANWNLKNNSPCINKGNPDKTGYGGFLKDLNGFNRFVGVVDIGAYEYQETTNIDFGNALPKVYQLYQNYPNPFNPATKIKYQLPKDGHVSIIVYDILGREVATLVDAYKVRGRYDVTFDASKLSSGIYIYQFRAADFVSNKKLILLK